MTPGPVEEAGKVAGTFMDIMRAQPLSLALVIMNLALLAFFWVILDRVDSHGRQRDAQLLADQKEIRELLSKCIVPDSK